MSGCVSFLFENNKTEEGKSKTKSPLDDYKTEWQPPAPPPPERRDYYRTWTTKNGGEQKRKCDLIELGTSACVIKPQKTIGEEQRVGEIRKKVEENTLKINLNRKTKTTRSSSNLDLILFYK